MFNGLSKDKAEQYLKPYAPPLLEFVEAIWADKPGHDDGERPAVLPPSRAALCVAGLLSGLTSWAQGR